MEALYSPQGRAVSSMVSTFGSGILCGAVITDITVEGKIHWSLLLQSSVAGITLVFFLILLTYYIGMFRIDIINDAVLKDYQDQDVLIAMMRKGQMKHLMKYATKQAKLGNLDQLHSIDKFLKGEYGDEPTSYDKPGKGKDTDFS